ncbi:L-alanine-DL-glutamate epimerase-like enolase superfamily enzyme [Thermosporothrix hazakensis]|jgi:L-alanine-DL-glutamate epimerase-like enolase superfamily enzyme|uniref:L-alanine-DL-glutamate epimerase-like enolase superfamily enzyme n=1 Tax=Thermosporothrix hazakensis TaxID=644383 RepID=A0A326UCF4_THEHA|nr:enolase C-terminal domain-like protein [Thermosporothrix hazakensis]PZW34488.1 L-alanine-DL-glutamate epimerase-like enolase superfamily enzyme [Thermosporothrix hazakensis]GCE45962.1 mandelate racemase [Thermosporothrix hazakensis]
MTSLEKAAIDAIKVTACTIPTDFPESDGSYTWDKTTIVLVEAHAGHRCGLGYTYADEATAHLIQRLLAGIVTGQNALDVPGCWRAMVAAIRNLGRPGISSMAIAAVDAALWDLKARLFDVALVTLLGASRECAPVYGSGGFTSYSREQLQRQLGDWAAQGIPRVKMKIGREPDHDIERVREAREAIGPHCALFVDANGAYSRKQALAQAERFTEQGVSWFEEPVSSDDLAGLRLIRDRAPAGMDIAAGEYGYDLWYFRRMLDAGAVDVLQADATRCAGITGFLRVAALCEAHGLPLSSHCGPALHVHACCAVPNFRHMEYFHDHVRIEHLLFDGVLTPHKGALYPDRSRPGMGLELKRADVARYAI